MAIKEETWNICPHLKTNFKCKMVNSGLWRLESNRIGKVQFGKWVFLIEPKDNKNLCPTFGDQRNFFTGLFEVEFRNDNFVFDDGAIRNSQHNKKVQMFKDILDDIEDREKSKIVLGIDYYLNKYKNEKDKCI